MWLGSALKKGTGRPMSRILREIPPGHLQRDGPALEIEPNEPSRTTRWPCVRLSPMEPTAGCTGTSGVSSGGGDPSATQSENWAWS